EAAQRSTPSFHWHWVLPNSSCGEHDMIFNIGIGLLVAWLAARKWSRLNGGLFLSCFMGFIIAWFAGGALSIAFSPESHTDAAMAAMTTGLWFSLAGAAAGGYLGKLHVRWDQRR